MYFVKCYRKRASVSMFESSVWQGADYNSLTGPDGTESLFNSQEPWCTDIAYVTSRAKPTGISQPQVTPVTSDEWHTIIPQPQLDAGYWHIITTAVAIFNEIRGFSAEKLYSKSHSIAISACRKIKHPQLWIIKRIFTDSLSILKILNLHRWICPEADRRRDSKSWRRRRNRRHKPVEVKSEWQSKGSKVSELKCSMGNRSCSSTICDVVLMMNPRIRQAPSGHRIMTTCHEYRTVEQCLRSSQ